MKPLWISIVTVAMLLPMLASAETKEEEMARMQRVLNLRTMGMDKPAPPPPAVVIVAPEAVVIEPVAVEPVAVVDSSGLSLSLFTSYRLAGINLGMAKSDMIAKLQAEGYACNLDQAHAMLKTMGRSMCMFLSSEAPKIAMFTLKNEQVRDFELQETYQTGFPEQIYKSAKQKFMGSYGSHAQCKAQRRGEVCEVFGHGYRIVLRSELRKDKAKITHSFHTM